MAAPPIISPPLIQPLDAHHDRAAFACGKAGLDAFLAKQAHQEMKRRVSVTYVLSGATTAEVAGYYTLAATSVLLADLPLAIAKRLPKYPAVPATLLGRLAVALRFRGQRLGELLLLDALLRCLETSDAIGSTAVITDAKDDEAASFYRHFDFQPFESTPRRLFIPMGTVAQLFA